MKRPGLHRLGRAMADDVNRDADAFVAEDWSRIRARIPAKPAARGMRGVTRALLAAAALAATFYAGGRFHAQPAPIVVHDDATSEALALATTLRATGEARELSFTDGTHVRLAPASELRVLSADAHGAAVLLQSGTLHANVAKHPGAHWSYLAGPYLVAVKGTAFELAWSNATLTLRMSEGEVEVTGCGLVNAPLRAGESLERTCAPAPVPAPSALQPTAPAPPSEPTVAAAAPMLSAAPSSAPAVHATRARTPIAPSSAPPLAAEVTETADSSWSAAQQVRATGTPPEAQVALTTFRAKYVHDARCSLAAFHLGLLATEREADDATAAHWFEAYLREAPHGGLEHEARGRLLEAYMRSRQEAEARRVAALYLEAAPEGPHAALARHALAEQGGSP